MKINRKLIAAFAMLSVVFGACTEYAPDVDCGIKSDLTAPASVTWDQGASSKTSLALTWDASAAIAAGATSFSAQVVRPNMETTEELHDYVTPDQYDSSSTVVLPVTTNYFGSPAVAEKDNACDQVVFANLSNGKQYMLRVRANYAGSNYSDWVWVTTEAGEPAHIKVGKGLVDPNEADDKTPPSIKVTDVTAADAIVTWSTTNWTNNNADFGMAYKLIVKKGNDLVVAWNIPANSSIWNSYAKNGCSFKLTALDPETEYNVTVQNLTEGTEPLNPTKFTTTKSPVVTLPTAPAAAGDVILYEDFSELFITADLSRGAAGYSYDNRNLMDAPWIAAGDDPVANDIDARGCYLVDPSVEVGLFNTMKKYVAVTRLNTWGMMAEDNTNGAICARSSHVKMGASSKCAWLVLPEIQCLQQTATVELSFDAALYETDPGTVIVEMLTGCTQSDNASNSYVTPSDRMTIAAFNVNSAWTRYTFTVDNVSNGARLAIGGNRNGVSGQHRFYLDNIEVKVVSYGDLKLAAPKNVVITPTDTTAEVVWDKVNSAEQYVVEYTNLCDACGQPIWTALPATAETKATIEGLAFQTEYSVRIKAVAGEVESAFCEPVAFTTLAEIKKLKTPKDVVAKAGLTTIELTLPAITKAADYEVYNGETKLASTFTEVEGVVTINVTGLTVKTAYAIQVKAVGAADGEMEASDLSEALAVSTGEISAYVSAGCEYKPTSLTAQWPDWAPGRKYTIQLADAAGVLGEWNVTFTTSSCVDGKGAAVPTRFTFGALTPETEYTVSVKAQAEGSEYVSAVLKTGAVRTAGAKDVYWNGFDDCFFGGDSHNMAYAVISKDADALKLIDWPTTTRGIYENVVGTSTNGPGSADRTSAIQSYTKVDPECSLYNWTLAGAEVHSGYLKIGAGGTIGVAATDVLGEKANGACTVSFKVSPRSDSNACKALVKVSVLHADGTETVVASGLDVLTNGDSFNYTWKTLEIKDVQLLPTDKLKIAGDVEKASGAFRFHLDDLLIVAQ